LCHRVDRQPIRGTCSFFPRDMLIFRGKEWAYGGYVQALACGEGMSPELRGCQSQAWDMPVLIAAPMAKRGTCPFFPRRRWPSAGHAHFFRGTCSFFVARSGHMGDMSRPRSVGRACPVSFGLPEPSVGHAHSFRGADGQARGMPVLSAGHAHSLQSTGDPPGRTCPFLMPRPGHRGYMSGPWCQRRACPAEGMSSGGRRSAVAH